MRAILFRGKRIDNGEWVEGFYCKMNETTYAFAEDYEKNPVPTHHYIVVESMTDWGMPNRLSCVEVVPETVCQHTGLTDKNGRKIFEADIVKIHQFLFDGCEYEREIVVSVEYIEDTACFGANLLEAEEIRRYTGYTEEDIEKLVIPLYDLQGLHEESFEIIGNVFDNVQLLRGA